MLILYIIYLHLTEDANKLILNALFSQYIIQSRLMLSAGGILILFNVLVTSLELPGFT